MSTVSTAVSEPVLRAIQELQADFAVTYEPTGDGGAIVVVHDLDLGASWQPAVIDLTFQIPYNYPFAAIYPYYAAGGLRRTDGQGETALQPASWRGQPHTQISLRANRWSPQVDTALGAVVQVQDWFRHR
jgi:Prokaryotic E2 family E